jgi:Family of unknown function (DUF6338)
MPDTFQAITIVILALLPGAVSVWAFERTAGRWAIETSDRVLRFAGISAAFLAVLAPLMYYLYATRVQNRYLEQGKPLSWWLWVGALAYVAVPYGIGRLLGFGAKAGWPWLRAIVGPQPTPRAWDYVFLAGRTGWIRLRLKPEFRSWWACEGAVSWEGPGQRVAMLVQAWEVWAHDWVAVLLLM